MSSWLGNSFKFGRNLNTGSLFAAEGPFSKYDKVSQFGQRELGKAQGDLYPKPPAPPPPPPNPNDAANAARELTDQMRMRRGLLSNIVAGGMSQPAPVSGKTQLGG